MLPSAPTTLLRKKITKRMDNGNGVTLYTVRQADRGLEKVAEIIDGHDVAWWLSEGDTVLVEVG